MLNFAKTTFLETIAKQDPPIQTWYIAYSGGLDSTVLLHWLWQQHFPLHAIHINHQLQPLASKWAEHCQQQCHQWHISCTVKAVAAHPEPGQSPEAAARAARYAAFAQIITAGTALCTAHHQDDQAETLLLQLMRGAGVAGLAAMPEYAPFAAGMLVRPLLSIPRRQLEQYAKQYQLNWIEDPTNENIDFDRNYIRHQIMPLLRHRWPSVSETCARSAQHCAAAAKLIAEQASQDYETIVKKPQKNKIQISKIKLLTYERQQQILRYWLTQNNLPLPSTAQLAQLQKQLLHSRADAQPTLHWPGVVLRRYRDHLYATGQAAQPTTLTSFNAPWDLTQPLSLPHGLGSLTAKTIHGQGISKSRLAQAPLTLRFRQGGERCQPQGRQHSQTLKKLFQEYGIPTWERDYIPLLFCGSDLAAVIGHWICAPFFAKDQEEAWDINLS